MSLIHTAELCGANPFDYLTHLQRHGNELKQNPQQDNRGIITTDSNALARGDPDRTVLGYDSPAWPKTIPSGHCRETIETARKTASNNTVSRSGFGHGPKMPLRAGFYARIPTDDQQTLLLVEIRNL